MPLSVDVKDNNNNKVCTLELKEEVFSKDVNKGLLYSSVKGFLKNRRRGTSSAKTRSDVRGGGKKPWKQKGTGRARAGSTRSPLRRGGGVVFGPVPREYSDNMTKKERKNALKCALSVKFQSSQVYILDSIAIEQPKTKEVVKLLSNLGITGNTLFLVSGENEILELAARNIPYVTVLNPKNINTYSTLNNSSIVCSKEAIIELEKRLS